MRIAQLHKLIDVANLALHLAANGFFLHVKLILYLLKIANCKVLCFLTSVENKDRPVDPRESPGEGE